MAVSVTGWIAYAALRGKVIDDDVLSAQALVRATDYIKYTYVARFVAPYNIDSPNVDSAIYEAANLELATPNLFNKTFTPSQKKVLTAVEGIKWAPVMSDSKERGSRLASPRSTLVDSMLAEYLRDDKTYGFFVV